MGDVSVEDVEVSEEIKYFQCANCSLCEKYEYFGKEPQFLRRYKLVEDAYVIEDPFREPRKGEILILGAHCVRCGKSVCKDVQCSFYYGGTNCIQCAKAYAQTFPLPVQEKLNRIVIK